MKINRYLSGAVVVACAFSFSGCSHKNHNDSDSTQDNGKNRPSISDAVSSQGIKTATTNSLPQADKSVPDSSYQNLTSGNQIMFMYYALSNLPLDYNAIASHYSLDYRTTNDEFKKHDLLNSLKPNIDNLVASAKKSRYMTFDIGINLGHYDFNTKSFQIINAMDTDIFYWNSDNQDYKYSFTNCSDFKQLVVANETTARTIESMVGKFPQPILHVFAFAQTTDPSNNSVGFQIVKVQLLNSDKSIILP